MSARICVIGAGRWGTNHVKSLAQLGWLAGVVESRPERRTELAEQYSGIDLHAKLDTALEGDYDGFVVATPAVTHFPIARRILEAARPVLVEKPMALEVAQARQLQALSEKMGVCLMVGHVLLFHPAILTIHQLVESGKIGKLQYLYSNRLNLGTVRTEENILWSFAPHDISIFQALTHSRPIEVVSRGGAFLQPQVHDSTMTILTYPNNVVGHIFVSWLHPYKEHRLVLVGSKGMLCFEDSSATKDILFYEKGIDWVRGEPVTRDGAAEIIPYERKPPLTEELRYFVEHLQDPTPAIAGANSGVEVLEILEQATASLLQERPSPGPAAPSQPAARTTADFYVHPSAIVDDHVEIGEGTKIWHFSHVQSHARIGRKCSLGQNVNVGNRVTIGNSVKIQNNVSLYEGVELEDYVFCGPSMVFTNVLTPRSKYPQRGSEFYHRTLVKEGASIGANATIVCGNTVGRHAFIAAGAVVTSDVPDYAVIKGVPGRRTGWMCECGQLLPKFDAAAACPRCKLGYHLDQDRLIPDSPGQQQPT